MSKRAVCLLSGGLDSTTSLAIAQSEGFEVYALSFRYGQRHAIELEKAAAFAKLRGVSRHVILDIDLRSFGGSALTADIPVPKGHSVEDISTGIPITYVPARNTIFLSLCLGWAEAVGARDIAIGVNALDYSGYPDCRAEFIDAFVATANLATKAGVEGDPFRLHTPLVHMTKADIVRTGTELGIHLGLSWSCYDPTPEGLHCGVCDSCRLRQKGFVEAGVADPTGYAVLS